MDQFLLGVLLVIGVLILGGLVRVWLGPTGMDRLVAISLVSVNGVAALVVLGFYFDRPEFFLDIALGFALLAFVLPIALGKYIERRVEQEGR